MWKAELLIKSRKKIIYHVSVAVFLKVNNCLLNICLSNGTNFSFKHSKLQGKSDITMYNIYIEPDFVQNKIFYCRSSRNK